MNKYYEEIVKYLDDENKEMAVKYALEKINSKEIGVVSLYEEVLAPALNNMVCKLDNKGVCIWKEHVRSSIIRTIIECCYPYIVEEERRKYNGVKGDKVIILCPNEEYHEIGARMVADYFTLNGYDSVFVGSNTPKEDFLSAIKIIKPKYIVISITNYFNLVSTKKIIDKIKENKNNYTKILVGGHAFINNPNAYKEIGADKFISTFEDIAELAKEELR